MVVAGALAWWLCTRLGADRPLFAVLVPLVAMDGDPFASVNISVTRTAGVFAGVFIGLGLIHVDLPSTVVVALLLALSLAVGLVLRLSGAPVNSQVAITAMFMLYLGGAQRAETVGVARIWETAVGAGVAIAVSVLVWPPHPLREARRRVARLQGWIAEDLARIAELLAQPDADAAEEELELVRERSLQVIRDVFEVERGERALRWNRRKRTDAAAFAAEQRRLSRLARQYRHLRTVARIVADVAADRPPLPADERQRLARMLVDIGAAVTGVPATVPPIDLAWLHDARAVGLAVKLGQMTDDLATP